MKIKTLNALLIINILTAILVTSIFYYPSSVVNIALGIPILLFFPGYALLQALFVSDERMDSIELVALSIGMSIAVVALIGFGLNYTTWGIALEPVLISISGFLYLMSAIALIRRAILKRVKLITEFNFKLPSWGGSTLTKSFSIILIALIVCAGGVLGYVISTHKISEKFTEFYILGLNGEAQEYPSEFVMQDGQVTYIRYGTGVYHAPSNQAIITLGIVNHEEQKETYTMKIVIDDEPVNLGYNGEITSELGPIELQPGERWEQGISFSPKHLGDNQKVEFLLFSDGDTNPINSLQLSIDATETFTEFYVLGLSGEAQEYPYEFIMEEEQVTGVIYDTGEFRAASVLGEVTLVIANHEKQATAYTIRITIDDIPIDIHYNGEAMDYLETTELQSDEVWEGTIGFAPIDIGYGQKVKFWLFVGDDVTADNFFSLLVNATEAQ